MDIGKVIEIGTVKPAALPQRPEPEHRPEPQPVREPEHVPVPA